MKKGLENYSASSILPLSLVSTLYAEIRFLWVNIIQSTHKLDYVGATSQLTNLHDLSHKLIIHVSEISDVLDLYQCIDKDPPISRWLWLVPVAIAIDIILLLLLVLFKRKKNKIKIN